MRHKISVSIDEPILLKIREVMRKERMFRSKSHVIEEALQQFLEGRT